MSETNVKSGKDTSEYQEAKKGSVWAAVATVLGVLVALASVAANVGGESSTVGIIAGAVLAIAGTLQQTFIRLGYIKSRTIVKAEASRTAAEEVSATVHAGSTADAIMAVGSMLATAASRSSEGQVGKAASQPER